MEPTHEEADREQQKALVRNASCSASPASCGCAGPAAVRPAGRSSRSPSASGTITTDTSVRISMVACQSPSRCCSIEANGTTANWPNEPPAVVTPSASERRAGGVCRLTAPKIGPKPAAAMPMPDTTLPSVSRVPPAASAIISMPATYSTPPAATVRAVPKRSATLPTNGDNAPISSTDSALANDHSSRPTPRSAAIGA
jgi:hypothetical protein